MPYFLPATQRVKLISLFMLVPLEVLAKTDTFDVSSGILKDPFYLLFFLIGISLLPFLAIMVTSFTKIVVVLSITRQAIGTAQTPPNMVIMSLAMILTCFSMYPVGQEIMLSEDFNNLKKENGVEAIMSLVRAAKIPIKEFLQKHTKAENKELFLSVLNNHNKPNTKAVLADDFIILAPAFLISELTLALQIGFLIYLPFLVVDMTVANLLMALGMQMLSPTTISLPFKLLLFVLADGWRLLAEGLVKNS